MKIPPMCKKCSRSRRNQSCKNCEHYDGPKDNFRDNFSPKKEHYQQYDLLSPWDPRAIIWNGEEWM